MQTSWNFSGGAFYRDPDILCYAQDGAHNHKHTSTATRLLQEFIEHFFYVEK